MKRNTLKIAAIDEAEYLENSLEEAAILENIEEAAGDGEGVGKRIVVVAIEVWRGAAWEGGVNGYGRGEAQVLWYTQCAQLTVLLVGEFVGGE